MAITKADKKFAIKCTKKIVKKRKLRKRIISSIKALNEENSEKELAEIFFENDCPSVVLRIFPAKISRRYFNRWLESDYAEVYRSVKFSNVLLEKVTSIRDNNIDYYEDLLYGAMIKVVSDSHKALIDNMNVHHNHLIRNFQEECVKEMDEANEEVARLEVIRAKLRLKFLKKS